MLQVEQEALNLLLRTRGRASEGLGARVIQVICEEVQLEVHASVASSAGRARDVSAILDSLQDEAVEPGLELLLDVEERVGVHHACERDAAVLQQLHDVCALFYGPVDQRVQSVNALGHGCAFVSVEVRQDQRVVPAADLAGLIGGRRAPIIAFIEVLCIRGCYSQAPAR